jgi:protein-tyrosine phosphatase
MPNTIRENDADMILPNLWLGNYKSALNHSFLKKYKIKYIVNVTTEIPCTLHDISYLHLHVDRKNCQISLNHINQAVDYIRNGLNAHEGVLVHCRKGHHRSASIVLAYLIKYHGFCFNHGINYIKSIRTNTFKRDTCMVNNVYQYYLNLSR